MCKVEKFAISSGGNDVNHTVILSLSNPLLHNTTLKTLDQSDNGNITIVGWNILFRLLWDSNSTLKSLNLSFNSMTYEGINALTNVLVNNGRLRELNLQRNKNVTASGWVALSIVLRKPTSALEKLDLSRNRINDNVMVSYADALFNNRKLRELILDLDTNSNSIFAEGYTAFAHILCNTSSVMSTYHFNHSLEKLSMNPTNSCCLMNSNCYHNSIAWTLRAKQLASRSLRHILVGKKSTCRHSQTWV
jgi:hypothetical protein